ncbi:hypothetical protein KPL74_13450 [Bacillus sp. NP157]|nr:hypothetical protein KPL74_13450 [Bacillus sp. NP157]
MTRRLLALASLVSLAFASHAATAPGCTATTPPTGQLIGTGLLTPSTPGPERERLAALLMCSALAGNANSMEVAGSLYRWGPRHPAHVFPEDHARARDLLTGAAYQGRLAAMFKLAELELAEGNAHEAMVWVQVENAYFRQRFGQTPGGDSPAGAGYYTMLLKRVGDALGPFDEQLMLREVNARFAAIDQRVKAQPPRQGNSPPLGQVHRPANARTGRLTKEEYASGLYAQYFVEVAPDGHIARRWLIDAYPEPTSGERLARAVDQMSWDALPAGNTEMRYVLLPVSMGSVQQGVKLQKP